MLRVTRFFPRLSTNSTKTFQFINSFFFLLGKIILEYFDFFNKCVKYPESIWKVERHLTKIKKRRCKIIKNRFAIFQESKTVKTTMIGDLSAEKNSVFAMLCNFHYEHIVCCNNIIMHARHENKTLSNLHLF